MARQLRECRRTTVSVPDVDISVVICCYNSAGVLPQTLAHLGNQAVDSRVRWEIVVVDNASTDGTADVANAWAATAVVPLRVVTEPRLGVGYARLRGIAEARGEIISFVDDDNWLEPGWIQTAYDVMRAHPEVGALGGFVAPEFESARPPWFAPVAYLYAVGPDARLSGDVTTDCLLCGAGLSVRRSAMADIRRKGFTAISVSRKGRDVGSGEDAEMTHSLRLAGWRLWIDPRLRIRHFLPVRRLDWQYARRLAYGSAFATPERDALVYAFKPPRSGVAYRVRLLRERWFWQLGSAMGKLMPAWRGVVKRMLGWGADGDADVLRAEFALGRVNGLIAMRRTYNARAKEIRQVMAGMRSDARG
jgi:glycosyltransferase involved in cell wall biosynthesis